MYGDLLKGAQPLGAPPPMKMPPAPPPQGLAPAPIPGATPVASPMPVGPPPPPSEEAVAANEAAHLAAYNAHQEHFLKQLAADYGAGKISREDMKKGAAYTGIEPYPEWKQKNVQHLKEIAKVRESQ